MHHDTSGGLWLQLARRGTSEPRVIHCIADNCATHNHPNIKAWLAARPRWHMHFVPTYGSWLNQVERFFSLVADRTIRRGSFTWPSIGTL